MSSRTLVWVLAVLAILFVIIPLLGMLGMMGWCGGGMMGRRQPGVGDLDP